MTKKTAHLEPIFWVLRLFDEGKEFGDEFDIAILVKKLSEDTVEFSALSGTMTTAHFRAIREAFKGMPFINGVWYRIKDGKKRKVVYSLKTKRDNPDSNQG